MDILEALATRKSVRGFKPDPVPREILREVLQISSRAPSAVNSQPWEFFALAGDVIEEVVVFSGCGLRVYHKMAR